MLPKQKISHTRSSAVLRVRLECSSIVHKTFGAKPTMNKLMGWASHCTTPLQQTKPMIRGSWIVSQNSSLSLFHLVPSPGKDRLES